MPKPVHIDELYTAFCTFQNEMRNAFTSMKAIKAAQAKFKAFCEEHNLPIDFTTPGDSETDPTQPHGRRSAD
jgi:hypothetical protein